MEHKSETIGSVLEEELGFCMRHIESFFNVLLGSDLHERIAEEIALAGQGLIDDMSGRVKEVCGVIEKAIGEIEFQRDCWPFPGYGPSRVVGVKLTIGEALGKALEGKELKEGLCLEVKQGPFA